jgi:hypothetical protein
VVADLEAVTIGEYGLVAVVAFLSTALAAISGYRAGFIPPLVLVPIIGRGCMATILQS